MAGQRVEIAIEIGNIDRQARHRLAAVEQQLRADPVGKRCGAAGILIGPDASVVERGTIVVPGNAGGANWSGAAVDPDTGMLYVGTYRLPFVVTVRRPAQGESRYDFIGEFRYLPGPRGLPLLKPPFGSMIAIDMNSGEAGSRWPGRSRARTRRARSTSTAPPRSSTPPRPSRSPTRGG